jgi:DNA-directed RNA polymerase specialized sigma24 family protein
VTEAQVRSTFDEACRNVVVLLGAQRTGPLAPEQEQQLGESFAQVGRMLPRMLGRKVATRQEAEETADEALERFVRRAMEGRVDADRQPAGLLVTMAARIAIDRARRRRKVRIEHVPDPEMPQVPPAEAESIIHVVEAEASAEQVRTALRRAAAAGDVTVLAVVAAWLDLAHSLNDEPTSRKVAEVVGMSKSTVANALARFHTLLGAS